MKWMTEDLMNRKNNSLSFRSQKVLFVQCYSHKKVREFVGSSYNSDAFGTARLQF